MSTGAVEAAELADAGRMAAMSRIAQATSILLAALALGGCGNAEESNDAGPTDADKVFEGVRAKGTTQNIRCNPVDIEVHAEPVVACSFEEERNESGVMRAVDRCFVVREGVLIDVSREVPVGTSCAVSSP